MGKRPGGKKEEKQTRQELQFVGSANSLARSQWEGKHPEPKSRVDERKVLATVKRLDFLWVLTQKSRSGLQDMQMLGNWLLN